MIRERAIKCLRRLAISLGDKAKETEWHLFGSVERSESDASDLDVMIFCKTHDQADSLRQAIDPDAFDLPLHLVLMTFDEAEEVDAARVQRSSVIFP